MFRHPKYYKELRKRALDERNRDSHVRPISGSADSATDQAISPTGRATGPGPKQQATSFKPQAASIKLQAASFKLQDLRTTKKFHGP